MGCSTSCSWQTQDRAARGMDGPDVDLYRTPRQLLSDLIHVQAAILVPEDTSEPGLADDRSETDTYNLQRVASIHDAKAGVTATSLTTTRMGITVMTSGACQPSSSTLAKVDT